MSEASLVPSMEARRKQAQKNAEQRKVRQDFRNILRDIDERQEDLSVPGNPHYQEVFNRFDAQRKNVSTTREGLLETHALLKLSKIVNRQTQALETTYVPLDKVSFAEQVTQLAFKGGAQPAKRAKLDWAVVGQVASSIAQPLPLVSMMYGPLSMDLSKRQVAKPTQRTTFDKSKAVVPSSNLSDLENEQDLTAARVKEVTKYLGKALAASKRRHPERYPRVGYFEFLVNPRDFGQTVENIFHFSFLVKDGAVELFLDEAGLPCIRKPMKPARGGADNGNGNDDDDDDGADEGWHGGNAGPQGRIQHVMSMSHQEWKAIIEAFNIKKPMLPHRKPSS
ncbi:hypothetical protein PTSG_05184 [Salpingoeca rosetta]|uniref:Non-structural maintenance of chromosomes element 4 n=1 Tax=Salpingoeca rosetta (strain ATCC 50818 / BSB-021) TaxID=946362 RepID=F2UAR3_SALR5|nr:uncharacterized protein PTSG_05184 [Salpingoeca rosetta]EGD73479.1 hypothetical protein PTSG_05184 [Salpingoeca rosetta]|eukprot:XP_004993761.1 hypothetical protein PTSG_05184 [Salpingoeca rosetta]